jgi:hypothetical protein
MSVNDSQASLLALSTAQQALQQAQTALANAKAANAQDGAAASAAAAAVSATNAANSAASASTNAQGAAKSATQCLAAIAAAEALTIKGLKGDKGDPGSRGQNGSAGAAATIAVGSVTTGAPGSDATVTNAGLSSAAVFNFSIPQGATGAAGAANTADTVATFGTTSYPASSQFVEISGYYTIGYNPFIVTRVSSEPSHPWKFRSADRYLPNGSTDNTNGGWWEGVAQNGVYNVLDFGAIPDGVTDSTTFINNAITLMTQQGGVVIRGTLRFPLTPYATEWGEAYIVTAPIVIGNGSQILDIIIEGYGFYGAEQPGDYMGTIWTTSATADIFQITAWASHTANVGFRNLRLYGDTTTGALINILTNQIAGLTLENIELFYGAYGFRNSANLVSPHFKQVSFIHNTTGMLVETEIDNGVWDHCIWQSCNVSIDVQSYIFGSAFYSPVFEYGTSYFITKSASGGTVPFLDDVTFYSAWFEFPAVSTPMIYVPSTSTIGMRDVKFVSCHIDASSRNADFIYTQDGTGNYSSNLSFYHCVYYNYGTGKLLNVDVDPGASNGGGYQGVTMISTWDETMLKPKGCRPPAIGGNVIYIGFIPDVNGSYGQPEYIFNAKFYTKGKFYKALSLPAVGAAITATTYTVADTDQSLIFGGSATCTVTLPDPTTNAGRFIRMVNRAAYTVVSASSNVVPLTGGSASTAILAATAGKWALLESDGTNWQITQAA